MYNIVVLVGNLTRDLEMKFTQGGMAIAKTAIATSRKFKSNTGEQKEEVCFVDITFFGRSAEIANQYLRKGSKILVEGRLQFEQWTDQNGQKRSKHGVTVDVMQMLDSKGNAPSSEATTNYSQDSNEVAHNQQQPGQIYNADKNSVVTEMNEKVMSDIADLDDPFGGDDDPF